MRVVCGCLLTGRLFDLVETMGAARPSLYCSVQMSENFGMVFLAETLVLGEDPFRERHPDGRRVPQQVVTHVSASELPSTLPLPVVLQDRYYAQ